MPEAKSWGETPSCVAKNSQDVTAICATWEKRRLLFIGGIGGRLAYQLPGKPAAGAGSEHVGSSDQVL